MSTTDQTADAGMPSEALQEAPARAGVRWKRFAGMLGVTGVLTAGMVFLTAQGVLAAQFSISGMPFVITADRLEGTGFEQFARLREFIPNSPNDPDNDGAKVLIVSAINHATLSSLCQAVDLGGKFLTIHAGDGDNPVVADQLIVDSDLIAGDATFDNIDIGQDASTLDKVDNRQTPQSGDKVTGNPGVFGQQAERVQILHLRQNNFATTAAKFTLPHLRMAFTDQGC